MHAICAYPSRSHLIYHPVPLHLQTPSLYARTRVRTRISIYYITRVRLALIHPHGTPSIPSAGTSTSVHAIYYAIRYRAISAEIIY